jgi:hypothetical protein
MGFGKVWERDLLLETAPEKSEMAIKGRKKSGVKNGAWVICRYEK